MRVATLLMLLPALVATQASSSSDDDSDGDSDPCNTLQGVAGDACGLAQEGFNTEAANYLASAINAPGLSSAIRGLGRSPAVESAVEAAQSTVKDGENTAPGVLAFSVLAAQVTGLPSGSQRDAVSSVFQHGFALQSNPSAAAAGSATAPKATASNNGATSGASGAAASSGAPSKAAAAGPRQTGLGVAAGVAAGMLGLAVGL